MTHRERPGGVVVVIGVTYVRKVGLGDAVGELEDAHAVWHAPRGVEGDGQRQAQGKRPQEARGGQVLAQGGVGQHDVTGHDGPLGVAWGQWGVWGGLGEGPQEVFCGWQGSRSTSGDRMTG